LRKYLGDPCRLLQAVRPAFLYVRHVVAVKHQIRGHEMRTLLLATTAILPLLAGIPANAADMPAKAPAYRAPPPVAYSWTGIYFGGHLGAGWTTKEWRTDSFSNGLAFGLGSGTASGFLGGAQIGINYQIDAMVFGIEGDFSWADLSGETCNTLGGLFHCDSKADRFGTVAGRLGIAVDRALVYFKGGAAWVHDTHSITIFGGSLFQSTVSANKRGWTAGAGVEYALTRNWSAKLEYDFMDFGTTRLDFFDGALPNEIKQRIHAVKFGWNYKFDWGGPVVANY
jgi:outer membrane immunogenic protein